MTTVKPRRHPPGPKPRRFIGNALKFSRDPIAYLTSVVREHGDIVRIWFPTYSLYLVNHPDYIEQILKTQQSKFIKNAYTRLTSVLLGNAILVTDGEFWRKQRRLAQPAFHHQRIKNYATVFVEYANRMLDGWKDQSEVDLQRELGQLTVHIVAKTLFNSEVPENFKALEQAIDAMMDYFLSVFNLVFRFPLWVPTPANLRLRKHKAASDKVIYALINARRQSGEDSGDLLSMLLRASDADDGTFMTDEQLRDEVLTLFMSGNETTAVSLAFALFLLSQNPDASARLQEELRQVLGGRHPVMDDMASLPFLHQVIMETLRLYPPAWSIGREAVEAIEVGPFTIPKGSQIGMLQWAVHRDARYFEEPSQFRPERWDADFVKKIPAGAYFPFGGGARVCIGRDFATMEMVLVLATILQRYDVHVLHDGPVILQGSVTLRPKTRLRARITPRPRTDSSGG
jgi:cytochrome P450